MRVEDAGRLLCIAKMSRSGTSEQRGNTALPEIKGTDDTNDTDKYDVWAWDGCL